MMAAMIAAAIAPAASAEEDKVVKLALQDTLLPGQQEIVDKFEAETGYKVEPILIPADQDMYTKTMLPDEARTLVRMSLPRMVSW